MSSSNTSRMCAFVNIPTNQIMARKVGGKSNGGDFGGFLHRKLAERTDILEMAWDKCPEVPSGEEKQQLDTEISSEMIEAENVLVHFPVGNQEVQLAPEENANMVHKVAPVRKISPSIQKNTEPPVRPVNHFEKAPTIVSILSYLSWMILLVFGYFRDFLRNSGLEKNMATVECEKQISLFSRNCYMRVRDVFERPISSVPGARVKLLDRKTDDFGWTFQYTGSETEVINMGSYNYLGFAQNHGFCADSAVNAIIVQGLSICSTVRELGCSQTQHQLESLVSEFLGVESAICFAMGFATNSMNAPCFVDKDCLIISDELNHASLILGCRLSGAQIRVFKHNDCIDLERVLRDSIAFGQPRTRRPYKKLLIIVEAVYSMEGSICLLPSIIALKKKYGAYLYLDEAHSIDPLVPFEGALGATGRGIVEYWGCNPHDVDVLMGTFTKTFGAAGGYIAGSKKMIDHLRVHSPTGCYSLSMSPPVARQVISAMSVIMGKNPTENGQQRIDRLAINTHYFRRKAKQLGFIVYGSDDSPIVPILLYFPTTCGYWGRALLKRQIGVVLVSFPATAMTQSRARFCISAAHDQKMLDQVLEAIDQVGDESSSKHSKLIIEKKAIPYL